MNDTSEKTPQEWPKWISVKDRLPEKAGNYLVRLLWPHEGKRKNWRTKHFMAVSHFEFEYWVDWPGIYKPTHWMPLPPDPEIDYD